MRTSAQCSDAYILQKRIDSAKIYCEGVKQDFPETKSWMDSIIGLLEGKYG